MCQPWVLCSCNVDESFPLLFPSQELLRARCFHAQNRDCCCTHSAGTGSVAAGCVLMSPAAQGTICTLLSSSCTGRLGPDVPANTGQSGLTQLKRVVGTRPASFSKCNFSPLKSVDVAACQEQGNSLLWA